MWSSTRMENKEKVIAQYENSDRLLKWRHGHNAPEKVAAAHRAILLARVIQSMAFENQPVDLNRLKRILNEASFISQSLDAMHAESYSSNLEPSERLAVPLVAIYDEILQIRPDQIVITSEWLCIRHKRLAGHLYPDWAGRFRDVDVQVGAHIPPPFYEVPIHMRQFCDDLAERFRHVGASVGELAGLLAWADWRFQWIHPFKDFNGRIGRVLLAALLYKLGLPHVETAPTDPGVRRKYLDALQSADQGELGPLTEIWILRVEEAL